jgi:hypothetical protein
LGRCRMGAGARADQGAERERQGAAFGVKKRLIALRPRGPSRGRGRNRPRR